jgi:hypothetical protein
MKKLILLFLLCSGGLMIQTSSAQISIRAHIGLPSIRANIGIQPVWGPVGYDHVDNYYLPDIETYYNVQSRQYTYKENGRWVNRTYLPARNRGYDLYKGRKVVVEGSRPYMRHNEYKVKYTNYNDPSNRGSIRDSRDSKYYINRNHPEYNNWRNRNRNRNNQNNEQH